MPFGSAAIGSPRTALPGAEAEVARSASAAGKPFGKRESAATSAPVAKFDDSGSLPAMVAPGAPISAEIMPSL